MKPWSMVAAVLLGAVLTAGGVTAFQDDDEDDKKKTSQMSDETGPTFLQIGKKYQFSWTNHRHATVLEIHRDGWVKISADAVQGPDVIEWLNINQVHFVREMAGE